MLARKLTYSLINWNVRNMSLLSMISTKPLNFIDGKRNDPTDFHDEIPVKYPATDETIHKLKCSSQKEVEKAVKSANAAFSNWSRFSYQQRGQLLKSAAQKIRENLETIAQMEVIDTGKPIWEARVDIAGCADVIDYYGGLAPTIKGYHHQLPGGSFAMVAREPLGVVAGIGAWNYPFQVMSWKLAPALVCGNTFVYKPSQLTPLTSVVLAEIMTEVGIPDGVVNVIQGDGETGNILCHHPLVSKVTFTGSISTGQKIMKACAEGIKKVTLELGGKSPLIVFGSCDIKEAVKATLLGNFLTQGEVCSNCTRVFVEKSISKEFIDQLLNATKNMIIGDPTDEKTTVGAMISEEHGKKVLKYIETAKNEGAHVLCGGERIIFENLPLSKGFFITPCILIDCRDDMTVIKEEIFGPVVSVLTFETEEEALLRANSTPYGLAAGVMSKDIKQAHRVASGLQAGIVWINNYNVFPPEIPFGGYKKSGFGRENGLAAVDDFSQLKSIYVEMNGIDCPIYKE
ncbi:4-trimethylaminobutyraldehyde dehydrogenase A-like [Centruroides vittatus]|uniref:4-trimethylaminobutyraldehyde dehydrogenase A-like n=1 Tax=Centruroides vittatus TaxID=120091 RepID=UPI00350F3F4D